MDLEQSMEVQLDYCLQELTETGKTWLAKRVAELSQGLDENDQNQIVEEVISIFEDDITHHAEKVIEIGFNQGRLGARCGFLIEQWEIEGSEEIQGALRECIEKVGGLQAYIGPKDESEEENEVPQVDTVNDASIFIDDFHAPTAAIWPDLAKLRKELAALASAPTGELVAKIARRFQGPTPGKTERVFLAQECRANGDDSSDFVLAILTNEESAVEANRVAEVAARENGATMLACHDGEMYYRLVRATAK